MTMRNAPILLSLVVALAACGGGSGSAPVPPVAVVPPAAPPPPPPNAAPPSSERDILPALTNAAVTTNLTAHVTIGPDAASAQKGRLFVMLPGTGGVPRFYRLVLRAGASRGYHAVGLTYPNDEAIELRCAVSTDPNCDGVTRNEVITGDDTSPVVTVNRANSITGRLISLLTYMNATYPAEGWGQYLVNGQPNWSVITVAGHSQGSGHAAYLTKLQLLDRSVMFSGPGDVGITPGSVSPWLTLPNVTPPSRQYGFTHTGDTLIPLAVALRNWDALGLGGFGATVSVDGATPPFGSSRKLTTSLAPNPNPPLPVFAPEHSSPILDAVTPLTAGGTPVYAPVWVYLAFP